MTALPSELAWLFAAIGIGIALVAGSELANVGSTRIRQLQPESRAMAWAMLTYGSGIAILGAVAGWPGGHDPLKDLMLAGWLIGGIVALAIVDLVVSARGRA